MNYVTGMHRNQSFITTLDSNVDNDSWARIVDLFVDALDLKKLGFVDELKDEGRPPYSAADLLKYYTRTK
ncbi:MAG: hypothetical protein R2771_10095 [Saprospiraceae bacterium]